MNKQRIEARIRELVPELQELSFGCQIRSTGVGPFSKKTYKFDYVFLKYDHDEPKKYMLLWKVGNKALNTDTFLIHDSDLQIIGHPITLEHCRVALRRYNMTREDIWMHERKLLESELGFLWQDLKPLSEQPNEVWEFLDGIL